MLFRNVVNRYVVCNTIENYRILLSLFASDVCRQGMNYTSLSFFVTFV